MPVNLTWYIQRFWGNTSCPLQYTASLTSKNQATFSTLNKLKPSYSKFITKQTSVNTLKMIPLQIQRQLF